MFRAIIVTLLVLGASAEDDTSGPVFVREPPNRIDFSNTTGAVVECSAHGNPTPDIIWVRSDGTAVGDVPGLRQVLANGNLVFPPFRAEDYRQEVHAQVYVCLAKNSVGSVHSRDVNVRAVVAQFYDTDVNKEYAIRGNAAILKCQIPSFVADFVSVVSWHTDQNENFYPGAPDDSKYLVLPSGELHIRDVGPEDGYKSYQCRTKHRLTGETRLSATKGRLVITEPTGFVRPQLISRTIDIRVSKLNETAVAFCPAQSFPVPLFRWYKFVEGTTRKQAVTLNDRVKQVAGTLIIREAKVEDSGKYLCVVNNSVGGESVETVLTVTAPLKAKIEPQVQTIDFGRPATFTCNFEGNPIKTISWLKDGHPIDHNEAVLRIESVRKEDKGMYQCFIRNDQESAEATAELKLGGRFEPPQIRHAFNEETVQPGNSVFLKCIASGNPTPEITWELYGRRLSNSERNQIGQYVTVNGDVVSHLNITAIHTNDGGLYRCVASSKVGSADHSARINVYGLPFVRSMEKQAIVAGGTLIVHCPFAGHPVDSVVWERDGRQLPINRKQKVFINGTLIIENVERASDQATYDCVAKNSQGYSARGSLEVQVMVPPQIIPFDFGEDSINEGDGVSVQCTVSKGDYPLNISWTLNGHFIDQTNGIVINRVSKRVSTLSIDNVQSTHVGNYTCLASNSASVTTYTTSLFINVPPQIVPFEFGEDPTNSGDLATVNCAITKGDLPINITWSLNGQPVQTIGGITVGQMGQRISTLSIDSVDAKHAGTYMCTAHNKAGTITHSSTLYVNGTTLKITFCAPVSPQIHPFEFGDESVNSGEMAIVHCAVIKGDLPLKITWTLNGRPIETVEGVSVMQTKKRVSQLTIDDVQAHHAGTYTCWAANNAGNASFSSYLRVNVPPRWILEPTDKAFAQGSDAAVECKADGFPRPVVTWKRATGVSPGDYKDFKPNNPDIKVEDGTLTINNIQKTNEGYYLCEAVNGIGSGLSAVIQISVQAPPQFDIKLRNQTSRRGDPAVLQCEAKGEKPIGILWNINNKRLEPKGDNRYTIREEILANGVLSGLSIKRTERSDSALFTCVATNAFGSDDTSINMIVQEVPEVPYGLKVLDKSGRSVQLSWVAPFDGNSPITRYMIEYKQSKVSWEGNTERVLVPGDQTEAGVFTLRPATTYHIRIVAENEIGSSEPSETVTIITAEEVPGGPPTSIRVETNDQHSLVVYWKPPAREEWNGDILGYYVGYRLANSDKPYLFETVEFGREEGKEHHLKISNLKTYTQYSVVVQAFNKVGAGPLSDDIKAYTAEGVPEQPPDKATCTTLTAQTIRVSWVSPPLTAANGVIKGYKVIYGPSDTWFDENTKDTKITAASETILHGLKKYTNYSMEVLAYTSGGDGVRTTPIHCQTEQDVPEAPIAVKALVMSTDSILASWKPPVEPNGIVEYYTVYYKPVSTDDKTEVKPTSQKIVPNLRNQNLSHQAKNLDSNLKYEFWVTAATTIGEGQPSKKVTVSPSASVPAKIASFDDTFTTTYKEDVTLPCLAVGLPPPVITWKIKGVQFTTSDKIRQQPDGSLFIRDVSRNNAGEYSCHVENDYGQDSVTHQLIVNAPPHAPQIALTSTTTNSLTFKLKPHESDVEPIHGYTIHYKPEFGDWETVQIGPTVEKYTLEKLLCGTRYQVYAKAYNSIGTGDPSDTLNPRTRGEKPIVPSAEKFIEVSSNSITLHLSAWSDGGCPMLYFVIEHKKKTSTEWIQVSNNVKLGQNFVLLDLDPACWYHLRVTAHNNAGFNVAEYEFATLTVTGGTIAPAREIPKEDTFQIILANLNLVVPVVAAVLVIIVAIIVICVLRGKGNYHKDDVVYNQSVNASSTLDKRRPDLRDELGYIAPPNRKLPPVPGSNYNTCDRIKRGMDDEICPYATFHLLGFREEMDPSKAMQFQTFPHPHSGTMGPSGMNTPHQIHSRSGSQSMPRQNRRYDRVGSQGNGSIYSPGPEYDDPANCAPEDEQYGSQYGGYGAPYDQYGSRGSIGRRSLGSLRLQPTSSSPEPPPPPPRNHDPSFNDSKDSNEISEAECDRDQLINSRTYGVMRGSSKDGMSHEEMRKLIERNETGQANGGLTAYDTVAV